MGEFKSFDEFQKELHDPAKKAETNLIEDERFPEGQPRRGLRFLPRKTKMYGIGFGTVLLLSAAGLFFLPIGFGTVRLHGNEMVSLEDVLFDGAVREPVNVLQISTSELEERLSHDVRIASVKVSRNFPAYIDVTVTERKPLAVVQEEFGYAFLDREGIVIRTASSIRGVNLPMVTGIKLDNVLLGDTVSAGPLLTALRFIGSLSPEGLGIFSEINVGNTEQFVAYTRNGMAVRLGEGDKIEDRARLAENMVNDVKARGLSVYYIDASLSSPYIKLKK